MNSADQIPWLPGTLQASGLTINNAKRLTYIVVDEIVDDVATLALHPWPVADNQGRVRFPDLEACRHAAVSLRALESQLYQGWLKRDPRVGDVFGAVLSDAAKRALARRDNTRWQLRSLLTPPIYDLSQDARVAAKLAYYAAMAPVLAKKDMNRWNLAEKAQPPVSAAKVRLHLGAPPASVPDA
jgi:hypothetical protein